MVKNTQNLTNSTEFRPTPGMQVWVDTAAKLSTKDVSEISRMCNISRTSWYRWIKDSDFRKWFKKEWEERLSLQTWYLDAIGLKNAEKHFKYWEAMQKRMGNLDDKPVNQWQNFSVTFVEYDD